MTHSIASENLNLWFNFEGLQEWQSKEASYHLDTIKLSFSEGSAKAEVEVPIFNALYRNEGPNELFLKCTQLEVGNLAATKKNVGKEFEHLELRAEQINNMVIKAQFSSQNFNRKSIPNKFSGEKIVNLNIRVSLQACQNYTIHFQSNAESQSGQIQFFADLVRYERRC